MKKTKKQPVPQIIIRKAGRGIPRREAFDKAQVGFEPAYQKKWVEKVSVSTKSKFCKLFNKVVPWYERPGRFVKEII
jgi:hypothetical protein